MNDMRTLTCSHCKDTFTNEYPKTTSGEMNAWVHEHGPAKCIPGYECPDCDGQTMTFRREPATGDLLAIACLLCSGRGYVEFKP